MVQQDSGGILQRIIFNASAIQTILFIKIFLEINKIPTYKPY